MPFQTIQVILAPLGDKADVEVFKEGRKCKFKQCKQVLSKYNPNEYCFSCNPKAIAFEKEQKESKLYVLQKKYRKILKEKIKLKKKRRK